MTERQKVTLDYLQRHPEVSKLRLAKLMHAERADLFTSVEQARKIVRYYSVADGKNSSKYGVADTPRAGSTVYAMPKSKAKPWLPYTLTGKRIAILSDLHIPKHDEQALQAAVDHCKSFGDIDTVLLNGDVADAEEFGSWAKSPKAVDTENALQSVRDGLMWIVSQFPKAKIIYKFGNHEERLDRYCWSRAPELVGVPHITWQGLLTIGDDLKPIKELERIEFVGEQRPVMAGKLTIFHGHELPKGLVNSVNPARGAFLRVIDTVLVGHHHRSSSHVEYNWRHEPINCWSVGCLCDLNPEYARINKWNHGHAVVDITDNGSFNLHNFKQMHNYEVVTA